MPAHASMAGTFPLPSRLRLDGGARQMPAHASMAGTWLAAIPYMAWGRWGRRLWLIQSIRGSLLPRSIL